MDRSRKTTRTPNKPKRAEIHPDLYKQLSHEAVDEDQPIKNLLHKYLCLGMDRTDLLKQVPDAVSAR